MLTITLNKDRMFRASIGALTVAAVILSRYGHLASTLGLAGVLAWSMCYLLKAAQSTPDAIVTLVSVKLGSD